MPPFRARAGKPAGRVDVDAKPARLEAVLDGGGRRSERADSAIMTDEKRIRTRYLYSRNDVRRPHWMTVDIPDLHGL